MMTFIKDWFDNQRSKLIGRDYLGRIVNRKLQELINTDENIVAWRRGYTTDYRGNVYNTYNAAVNAINNKYNSVDDWGILLTGNIIDVRSAFTVPAGLNIVKITKDDIPKEMAFAREFIDFNGLNDEIPFEFSKESEIEGKLCVQDFWEKDHEWKMEDKVHKGMVKIRFLSWTTHKYKVITTTDYMNFEKIIYTEKKKEVVIEQPEFTYRRFGGRIDRPNEPAMKIWKCLTQIDSLDMALRDWREINRIFASPTPYFKTKDVREAKELKDNFLKNWKIKKALASPAEFSFVQPAAADIDVLEKEIITLAKIISGTTGVPVHFLGLPDLMSNRSTAENLMELVWASTVKERETWNSAYTEILKKAIDMFNKNQNGKRLLRNDVLRIEIQEVSSEQWQRLEKVLLPAYMANAITLDYFLSQIPGLILEEEKDRREEEEKGELEKTKEELNQVMKENDELQKNQFIKEDENAVPE